MSKPKNLVDNGQLRKLKTEKKPPRAVLRGVDKVDKVAVGQWGSGAVGQWGRVASAFHYHSWYKKGRCGRLR